MVEPVTAITASVIANLAFQKFVEAGVGKVAEKLTEGAVAKMDELRKLIWNKLRGRSPNIDFALEKVEQGDKAALNTIAKNLDVVMDEDPEFATQVQTIAHEITLMLVEDNSSTVQNNYGGTNYQNVIKGAYNTNFIGGEHHHG
ncbi:hypothetical protein NDI45_02385 [Leptolyngbya sp. GB1-A1]|uniref:hypothetical protein n=1 Tax=Leptolyngbya sp. GB1-A1 TaxID=2933908 RepID=UPI0032985232